MASVSDPEDFTHLNFGLCLWPKSLNEHTCTSGLKISQIGASLVAQWLRVCLPMQGTRVQALVWEDPTCRGATRPVSHNY